MANGIYNMLAHTKVSCLRKGNTVAKIQNPGESDPVRKRFAIQHVKLFSDGGACTGLTKLLHTDMHLPFCTNDLGHQDHLNVLPLHPLGVFFHSTTLGMSLAS